jgi:hypothetical protein
MKPLVTILLATTLVCACKQHNTLLEKIEVGLGNERILASRFIEQAKVIPLETNDDCLIHSIHKIQYINERIYILDIRSNVFFIFDNDGRFVTRLSSVGGGPGEYVQIMDFFVCDDFIYLMDFSRLSILQYSSDLTFLTKIKYGRLSSKFVVKDDMIWTYNEPTGMHDDNTFTCMNAKGHEMNRFLPRPFAQNQYTWTGFNAFAVSDGNLYVSSPYGNRIYVEEQ